MNRRITITDTTIRDGQQSLWATRMPTAMMVPVAERLQRSGVDCVDVTSHACVDSAVRFLGDDPWERVRVLRRTMSRPELAGSMGGKNAWGFKVAPPDILELNVHCLVRSGVDRLRALNGILDHEMIVDHLRLAKDLGAKTIGALVFSISPVHTDELYEEKARELVEWADVDWVMIKDSGGLLTPERTGPLVDAVRRGARGRPVTLHSHCMTGMAPRVYMIGVEHGVDDLQCGIWPLALGSAQPSMQTTVRNLREEGYEVDLDDAEIDAASRYLVEAAQRKGFPLGAPAEYDHFHYHHQVPGGMISNLHSQLEDAGLTDRLEEILQEVAIVRSELGWPTMVTPYSQFVGSQAVMNVVTGERYTRVPDEVKMYALGYFGRLLAPIDPDVVDRIMMNGAPDLAEPTPLEPAIPELRRRYPKASDEELFLRYFVPEEAMDTMLNRRDDPEVEQWRDLGHRRPSEAARVIPELIGHAANLNEVGEVVVQKGDVYVRVRA